VPKQTLETRIGNQGCGAHTTNSRPQDVQINFAACEQPVAANKRIRTDK
jgi:hypothetical protein